MSDKVTIWIVNEAGHDFSKATEAVPNSILQPLTIGDVNPTSVDRLLMSVARGIARFAKAEDYILISGTPVLNALVMTLWMIRFGSCNFLQWDARNRRYRKYELSSERIQEILDSQIAP